MTRVLFWSPNYAPELIGIPPLVTDAASGLAARGHSVQVVTAMPNYPGRRIFPGYRGSIWRHERMDGVDVSRTWLRVRPRETFVDKALYEASFALCSLPLVLRRVAHADVLVCVIPSLAAAILAAASLRLVPARIRPRLVLWVQDLVVDAAALVHGAEGAAARAMGLVRVAESSALRAANAIVVCSPGFERYLRDAGVPNERIHTILNWVDTGRFGSGVREPEGPVTFLYTGNLGYSQGFETLIDAARRQPELVVRIVGDGNTASRVSDLARTAPNVMVEPSVPTESYPALVQSASALVVIQRSQSAGVNLPSKIAPYLASGRPIVASIDTATPAADLLAASGAALVVPPERSDALADAMARLAADPALRASLGAAGRRYAAERLERASAIDRFEEVLVS